MSAYHATRWTRAFNPGIWRSEGFVDGLVNGHDLVVAKIGGRFEALVSGRLAGTAATREEAQGLAERAALLEDCGLHGFGPDGRPDPRARAHGCRQCGV